MNGIPPMRKRTAVAIAAVTVVGYFAFAVYREQVDLKVPWPKGTPTTCLGLASTQRGFSKDEWLQADPVRKRELAHTWVNEHRFLGLTKDQVIDALGKPASDNNNIFCYGLGAIDHSVDSLEIIFDRHGKAAVIAFGAAD